MNATPTQIESYNSTEMLLAWNSGERYAVPYFEIRFQCPCASCVDEHTGQRVLKREQIQKEIRPLGVQLIGKYAIQINWSDSHSTGMYHFDKLLELCKKYGRMIEN